MGLARSSVSFCADIVIDAAGGHRVARVDDEIDQRGFELGDVDHDRPDVAVDVELQRHRAADAGVEHFAHRIDPFGDVDRLAD